jgi:hypothetical protein
MTHEDILPRTAPTASNPKAGCARFLDPHCFPIALADPPGALLPTVSFLGGFRTPALVPVDRSALAGIRNPSHKETPVIGSHESFFWLLPRFAVCHPHVCTTEHKSRQLIIRLL